MFSLNLEDVPPAVTQLRPQWTKIVSERLPAILFGFKFELFEVWMMLLYTYKLLTDRHCPLSSSYLWLP